MRTIWASKFGEVVLTHHAEDRMRERGIQEEDVERTLTRGTWQRHGSSWRVTRGNLVVMVSSDGVVKTTFSRDS